MDKKLLQESARYITGRADSIQIKASPEKARAYRDVLSASRALYEALKDRNANLKIISKLLSNKKVAAKNYHKAVGEVWPM